MTPTNSKPDTSHSDTVQHHNHAEASCCAGKAQPSAAVAAKGSDQSHDHQHEQDHDHTHSHAPAAAHAPTDCCTPDLGPAAQASSALKADDGALLLRIPAMDCPVEEGQIRQILEGAAGVKLLQFDLPARTLRVEADPQEWAAVTEKIQAAGFSTETLSAPPAAADVQKAQRRELYRLIAALVVAATAELMHLLSPETFAVLALVGCWDETTPPAPTRLLSAVPPSA